MFTFSMEMLRCKNKDDNMTTKNMDGQTYKVSYRADVFIGDAYLYRDSTQKKSAFYLK